MILWTSCWSSLHSDTHMVHLLSLLKCHLLRGYLIWFLSAASVLSSFHLHHLIILIDTHTPTHTYSHMYLLIICLHPTIWASWDIFYTDLKLYPSCHGQSLEHSSIQPCCWINGRTICPYLAQDVNLDYKNHALPLIVSFILLASCFSANKPDKCLLPQSFLNK